MTVVVRRPAPPLERLVIEFEQGHAHVSVTFALGLLTVSSRRRWPALSVTEDFLRRQMTGVLGPDPAVIAAAGALSLEIPVGEVSGGLGLLPRTLRRRFTAQVGLTPKRFARVQRLQRLVRDLDGQTQADWAAMAARHGYADQPHLADEFRELVGVTPSGYLRSRVDGPNHLLFRSGQG